MSKQVSYKMDWSSVGESAVLSVIETTRYRVNGPLTFDTDHSRPKGVWRMRSSPHEPVCTTVEEMVERGWIEEVSE